MTTITYLLSRQTPKASRQTWFETVFEDNDECEDANVEAVKAKPISRRF